MGNLLTCLPKSVKKISHNDIPFDIQLEIIKKVTALKSLLRLRAVSKPWKAFIDSSEFINSHSARPTNGFLLRYKDKSNEVRYICFVDDENNTLTKHQKQPFVPKVSDLFKQLYPMRVVGICDGLLCFYSVNKNLFAICNRSIGKFVCVALPSGMQLSMKQFCGFLVSPVTNDPTIVLILYPDQIAVFTLSSKRWTLIPCTNLPPEATRFLTYELVIGSCIYSVVFCTNGDIGGDYQDSCKVMSFDLVAKELRFINIPNSLTNSVGPVRLLTSKLRESLVLYVSNEDLEMRVCGLWKMEHDESFTKLFTISTPNDTIIRLLGFMKNGLVMETQKDEEEFVSLEVYEPCSKHVNNCGIYGQKGFLMESHKETLLLLNHSNGCVYPDLS